MIVGAGAGEAHRLLTRIDDLRVDAIAIVVPVAVVGIPGQGHAPVREGRDDCMFAAIPPINQEMSSRGATLAVEGSQAKLRRVLTRGLGLISNGEAAIGRSRNGCISYVTHVAADGPDGDRAAALGAVDIQDLRLEGGIWKFVFFLPDEHRAAIRQLCRFWCTNGTAFRGHSELTDVREGGTLVAHEPPANCILTSLISEEHTKTAIQSNCGRLIASVVICADLHRIFDLLQGRVEALGPDLAASIHIGDCKAPVGQGRHGRALIAERSGADLDLTGGGSTIRVEDTSLNAFGTGLVQPSYNEAPVVQDSNFRLTLIVRG